MSAGSHFIGAKVGVKVGERLVEEKDVGLYNDKIAHCAHIARSALYRFARRQPPALQPFDRIAVLVDKVTGKPPPGAMTIHTAAPKRASSGALTRIVNQTGLISRAGGMRFSSLFRPAPDRAFPLSGAKVVECPPYRNSSLR